MQDSELQWLVENRSKIQAHLWGLLKFLRRDDQRRWLTHQPLYSNIFGLLVGSGYSLWRAVFLMGKIDKSGDRTTKRSLGRIFDEANNFLELLVRDNAIGYVQESKTRVWTSKYYLNGAIYRMQRIAMKLKEAQEEIPKELSAVLGLSVDFGEREMTHAWEVCYFAACATLRALAKRCGNRVKVV